MAGEVRHLGPIEDGELNRLLRARRQLGAGLVELLHQVDRRQVGAAELGQLPTQREAGPDAPDEARIRERAADVRDRRLRQPEPAGELARPGRDAAVLGQQVEDRRRPGDRRGERVGLRARILRQIGQVQSSSCSLCRLAVVGQPAEPRAVS